MGHPGARHARVRPVAVRMPIRKTTDAALESGRRAYERDAWAEAFSAGVRQPGDLMLMYGSTMFFVQVLERLASVPQLWTTAGVDPGTYTLAAGMSTSGSLTGWVQELTGNVSFTDLVQEAAAVPAGSNGLASTATASRSCASTAPTASRETAPRARAWTSGRSGRARSGRSSPG